MLASMHDTAVVLDEENPSGQHFAPGVKHARDVRRSKFLHVEFFRSPQIPVVLEDCKDLRTGVDIARLTRGMMSSSSVTGLALGLDRIEDFYQTHGSNQEGILDVMLSHQQTRSYLERLMFWRIVQYIADDRTPFLKFWGLKYFWPLPQADFKIWNFLNRSGTIEITMEGTTITATRGWAFIPSKKLALSHHWINSENDRLTDLLLVTALSWKFPEMFHFVAIGNALRRKLGVRSHSVLRLGFSIVRRNMICLETDVHVTTVQDIRTTLTPEHNSRLSVDEIVVLERWQTLLEYSSYDCLSCLSQLTNVWGAL